MKNMKCYICEKTCDEIRLLPKPYFLVSAIVTSPEVEEKQRERVIKFCCLEHLKEWASSVLPLSL